MSTMRENSRAAWTGEATIERINAGSFQRIADAAELMAKGYANLLADAERYRQWYKDELARRASLERRNASLRGVITRMKNAAKATGGAQ